MTAAMHPQIQVIEQFRQAMYEKGIPVSEDIIPDGVLHRVHVDGDGGLTKNGFYVLHADDRPAGSFGCNKRYGSEAKFNWSAKTFTPLTPEERRAFAIRMDEQKAERAAAQAAVRAAAMERAHLVWDAAQDCETHPYLTRKGVACHGLRVGRWEMADKETGELKLISAQALLVPLRDIKKKIHSLQAIFPTKLLGDRDKDYLSGGAKQGLFYSFGKPKPGPDGRPVIMIGEGYATLASAHECTGHACAVAFDASNLTHVGRALHERFPDACLLFLADNDQWTVPTPEHPHIVANPGITNARAAAKAVGGLVAIPDFAADAEGRPTDFNDLHELLGADAVRAAITEALEPTPVAPPPEPEDEGPAPWDDEPAYSVACVDEGHELAAVGTALATLQRVGTVENSEDELAVKFVEVAVNLRWSPGLGWMVYDGVVWSRDDALQRFDQARQLCRAVADGCRDAKSKDEAKRITSARTVSAVLSLAQSDRQMVVPTSEWDRDPMLLNTPSGVVDLRTGVMRDRGVEYLTQVTAVAPDFSGGCPTWLRFLDQVFLGDRDMIEFMRRSMGYWLSGNTREQVIHFLYGKGSNGKSVLTDLVSWISGRYGLKLAASALMQQRGERHPTELAQLRGKRLAMSSELGEHDYFNEALLKELSGDATLSARFMRGDFFEFTMTQKHLLVGNFKPRLRGGDPAMVRRLLLVPFTAVFKDADKDVNLPEKLRAEAPSILAWMIQGAVKWYAEGLAVPESVRGASAEYMNDNDDMAQWIAECCQLTGETKASDLYASFSKWKKDRGENPSSQAIWGARLSEKEGITKRRSDGVKYSQIQLAASAF